MRRFFIVFLIICARVNITNSKFMLWYNTTILKKCQVTTNISTYGALNIYHVSVEDGT